MSKVQKKAKHKKPNKNDDELFNFKDEIVIGINNTNKKKKTIEKKSNKNTKANIKTKPKLKQKKQYKKAKKFVKWLIIIILFFTALIYFMMSPLFNIRDIQVANNTKVTTEEILSLSGINKGQNIFAFYKPDVIKNIENSSYIKEVELKRTLPNLIKIIVEERKATYMIEIGNMYAYIDNQGYILEISSEKLDIPTLSSVLTAVEDIKVGNRLGIEDLEKLSDILELMSFAETNDVATEILSIDIADEYNYVLTLTDSKVAYLGDISEGNNKMLHLKAILQKEKGIPGEIFLNKTNSNSNIFFREQV